MMQNPSHLWMDGVNLLLLLLFALSVGGLVFMVTCGL
jgi:hypothetical protein